MIRPAAPDDLPQIAALVRTSFDARLHDFMVYAQHGIADFIGVHIGMPMPGPARRFLVHVDRAGAVGAFAEFHEGVGNTAFLSYICVSPALRGQGVATALIERFLASTSPDTVLQLDVFAENAAALALYTKLGFEQVGATGWFMRHLSAPAGDPALRLTNAVEAAAMYAHYGFCRHGVEWRGAVTFLGRIGPRTLRCFSAADFADDRLLAAAGYLFDGARQALLICSTDQVDRPDDARLIQTSLRLTQANRCSG